MVMPSIVVMPQLLIMRCILVMPSIIVMPSVGSGLQPECASTSEKVLSSGLYVDTKVHCCSMGMFVRGIWPALSGFLGRSVHAALPCKYSGGT